ncbi:30S ribosomal protein S31 [Chryseobacterium defluvii]|uniref:30S ribosomal protein S31 n=1 Tax=Chryseobacterium defluvii TaxID=160396 RepID=A0A840KIR4_9FLAO|nr:30S ribosomal protein S31 [Chryseobacterium defluvii]
MGKGDKKTKRGKINMRSYGKTRPKKASRSFAASEKTEASAETPKAKKTKKAKDYSLAFSSDCILIQLFTS